MVIQRNNSPQWKTCGVLWLSPTWAHLKTVRWCRSLKNALDDKKKKKQKRCLFVCCEATWYLICPRIKPCLHLWLSNAHQCLWWWNLTHMQTGTQIQMSCWSIILKRTLDWHHSEHEETCHPPRVRSSSFSLPTPKRNLCFQIITISFSYTFTTDMCTPKQQNRTSFSFLKSFIF